MNKKLLVVIGVAVLAAGAWYFLKERERAEGSALILQGNVDIREVNLGFRVGGRLADLERLVGAIGPDDPAYAPADAELTTIERSGIFVGQDPGRS